MTHSWHSCDPDRVCRETRARATLKPDHSSHSNWNIREMSTKEHCQVWRLVAHARGILCQYWLTVNCLMSHFLISNVLQVGYTIKLEDKILGEMNLFASSKSYFDTIRDSFCRSRCFSQSIFIWCWQWYLWLTLLCQAPFQVLSPTKNKTKQKKRGTVAIRIFCKPE